MLDKKRGLKGPFFLDMSPLWLAQGVDKFDQTRNFAAGGCFMDNTFGGGFIDKRYGAVQCRLGIFEIASGNSSTYLLDEGAHGAADMGVAGVTYRRLAISFQSGFVVGQGFASVLTK